MSEIDISPDTLLGIAPEVRLRFGASGHLLIDSPTGTVVDAGPRGLAIAALFAQPVALGTAIAQLEATAQGSTDFAPTMGVINLLLEEGALVAPGVERGPISGWADPVEHSRMLHDARRTGDYIAAITAAVKPGDIVLDIGTGSGVLAVAAARAGARQVYAVEASDIATVAAKVFAANGVQDRVTLLPGWSRHIDLPDGGRPGVGNHRKRAAGGGDPRDNPRCPPSSAPSGGPNGPPHAHAARAAAADPGR